MRRLFSLLLAALALGPNPAKAQSFTPPALQPQPSAYFQASNAIPSGSGSNAINNGLRPNQGAAGAFEYNSTAPTNSSFVYLEGSVDQKSCYELRSGRGGAGVRGQQRHWGAVRYWAVHRGQSLSPNAENHRRRDKHLVEPVIIAADQRSRSNVENSWVRLSEWRLSMDGDRGFVHARAIRRRRRRNLCAWADRNAISCRSRLRVWDSADRLLKFNRRSRSQCNH